MEMLLEILKGAGLGFLTVFIAWAKKQEVDKFNWRGLALRVPTGMIIGIIGAIKGLPFDNANAVLAGIGVIMIVDHLTKLVVRRIPWLNKKTEPLRVKVKVI